MLLLHIYKITKYNINNNCIVCFGQELSLRINLYILDTDEYGKKCTSNSLSEIWKECVWKVAFSCIQKFEMEIAIELAILP